MTRKKDVGKLTQDEVRIEGMKEKEGVKGKDEEMKNRTIQRMIRRREIGRRGKSKMEEKRKKEGNGKKENEKEKEENEKALKKSKREEKF